MKFPNYLKYFVDTEKYRLVSLAKRSNVHASDLSKVLNKKKTCGLKMAIQVIEGLEPEHQAQALMLWIADQIPPQFQHLLYIVRADDRNDKPKDVDIRTIEGSIQVLEKKAETNDALRTVLLNLAQAFAIEDAG
jgi:hypothetical protein